jgi:hypothetical protein
MEILPLEKAISPRQDSEMDTRKDKSLTKSNPSAAKGI